MGLGHFGHEDIMYQRSEISPKIQLKDISKNNKKSRNKKKKASKSLL